MEERCFPYSVEDEIKRFADLRKIFSSVVNDSISTEASCEVKMGRRYDCSHLGTIDFRKLHCRGSNRTRRTVDQDLVARFEVEFPQVGVCIPSTFTHHDLVKAFSGRHGGNCSIFREANVLCMGTVPSGCQSEYTCAGSEFFDIIPDQLDGSREV